MEKKKIEKAKPSQMFAIIPFRPVIFKPNIFAKNFPQIKKDSESKNQAVIIKTILYVKLEMSIAWFIEIL